MQLGTLTVGDPIVRKNLTIFPLLGAPDAPPPRYVAGPVAFERGLVEVRERSDGPSVPDLDVVVTGPSPVLLVEGETDRSSPPSARACCGTPTGRCRYTPTRRAPVRIRRSIADASSGSDASAPRMDLPARTSSRFVPRRSSSESRSLRDDAEMPSTATTAAIPIAIPAAVSDVRSRRKRGPSDPSASASRRHPSSDRTDQGRARPGIRVSRPDPAREQGERAFSTRRPQDTHRFCHLPTHRR
jgi:hypothetical protein